MRSYAEHDADNARWDGFAFRPGDVVISAPSKSGTTWTQLLVALLIFDGPDFPAPLGALSPWMDHFVQPLEKVRADLAAQTHRRFIKTHTPLDGLPLPDEVRFVCVGRDPRDAVVSMAHHRSNLDRERYADLLDRVRPTGVEAPPPSGDRTAEEDFDRFLDRPDMEFPAWTIQFVAHNYRTFWDHRDDPNVALFHFADYLADLPVEVERLGAHLGMDVDRERAERLAAHASIDRARERAAQVAPEANLAIWKRPEGFFRSGGRGEWRELMTRTQQDKYERLVAELMPPDLATWVHHGWGDTGPDRDSLQESPRHRR